MKKLFLFIFLFVFIIPLTVSGEEKDERIIVNFDEKIDYELLKHSSIEVHHVFEEYSAVSLTIPSSEREWLTKSPAVKRIDPDPEVRTESTPQMESWGYKSVKADISKSMGLTGKGVKVGVIDTGIKIDHPDLKVAGGISFVDDQSSYHDDEGHGTHVAGIIGAQDNSFGTVGVAPLVKLYAIKSLDSSGLGNQSDIVAGIEWAIQQDLDIINLSITANQGSYLLQQVIDKAYSKGIIIVAASGNALTPLSSTTDVLFPARYPNVIAVGSVDAKKVKSSFSYFGPSLELVAPGEEVFSTYSGYVDGVLQDYAIMDGTSMAAPYVAGIAALYKQAYPEKSHKEIRVLMQKSAIDLGKKGKDSDYGYGMVQAPNQIAADRFPDIKEGIWYEDEVSYLNSKNLITGYEDGYFYPNKPVSRAEAITMIGRALNLPGDLKLTRYSDVPDGHYASGYIETASSKGIVNGFPDGTFKPRNSILRGDAAIMLDNAFSFAGDVTGIFSDVKENKHYYKAVYSVYNSGIATGYPDATFKPENNITRAEFAVLLARALEPSFR
ncbi:S8 family peptidase [Cytobacillus firmus]|uniref:S8 family peptidase n=1 Tax=Cytobacillus firmus TaxID=1399 RepID=UPI001CFCF7BA|nr:S8 family serine peptidase [Cytobacillus firmus]